MNREPVLPGRAVAAFLWQMLSESTSTGPVAGRGAERTAPLRP